MGCIESVAGMRSGVLGVAAFNGRGVVGETLRTLDRLGSGLVVAGSKDAYFSVYGLNKAGGRKVGVLRGEFGMKCGRAVMFKSRVGSLRVVDDTCCDCTVRGTRRRIGGGTEFVTRAGSSSKIVGTVGRITFYRRRLGDCSVWGI